MAHVVLAASAAASPRFLADRRLVWVSELAFGKHGSGDARMGKVPENADDGRGDGALDGDKLAAKVAFLRQPSSYPERPGDVETVETHFAYLFLAGRQVYKLKKPIRYGDVDYTHRAARRASCELEVALNRRLAPSVYLGVVALTARGNAFQLDGDGPTVDWLVQMRRLDRQQTLKARIRRNAVTEADLDALIEMLVAFYRRTTRAPWPAEQYLRQLQRSVDEHGRRLRGAEFGLDVTLVGSVNDAQSRFLRTHAAALESRVHADRVVDAHGDLRPEHVFFDETPQIIDCLEFSQTLRWLDAAEEIAFLALECSRLGAEGVGERLTARYIDAAADATADALLGFYRSRRATERALLAAWRTRDHAPAETIERWHARAAWYLQEAARTLGE